MLIIEQVIITNCACSVFFGQGTQIRGIDIFSRGMSPPFENRIIFFFESKLRAITVRPNFPVSQCCGNLQFGKRRFSDTKVQHYIVVLLNTKV